MRSLIDNAEYQQLYNIAEKQLNFLKSPILNGGSYTIAQKAQLTTIIFYDNQDVINWLKLQNNPAHSLNIGNI